MASMTTPDPFISELRGLVDKHVRPNHDWYSKNTKAPRLAFRTAGLLVVVGSLTLPAITTATGWPYRDPLLTAVSLMVAILSSVSAFYRWDLMWQTRTKTASDLYALMAKWELELQAASLAEKPDQAAFAATKRLFDEVFASVSSETTQFFTSVKWPEVPKAGG